MLSATGFRISLLGRMGSQCSPRMAAYTADQRQGTQVKHFPNDGPFATTKVMSQPTKQISLWPTDGCFLSHLTVTTFKLLSLRSKKLIY